MTTAWYPNRKQAGDGVFVRKHALALARLHHVVVLMVQSDITIKGLHTESETRHISVAEHSGSIAGSLHEVLVYVPKVRVEIPILTALLRFFWYLCGSWKGYRIAKQLFDRQRPDICHVNVLTRAALLPYALRRLHHIPYIITEHWSRYGRDEFPHHRFHLWLTRLMVKHAAAVCPVSRNLQDNMLRWRLDNPNYEQVNNVVNTDMFTLVTHKQAQTLRFIHVSWMRDHAKNLSGILRVLSRLSTVRKDFHLTIVGDGVDKNRLQTQAEELKLCPDRVTFLPGTQGEALVELLHQHDCLLMFSNYENQPVSILEALACGMPVIASAVGSIPDMLADGRGIVVQPGDEEGLLETLAQVCSTSLDPSPASAVLDFSDEMRQKRRRYVVQHFSPQHIAGHFTRIYHSILDS